MTTKQIWVYKGWDIMGRSYIIMTGDTVPKLTENLIALAAYELGQEKDIVTDAETFTTWFNRIIMPELDKLDEDEITDIENL